MARGARRPLVWAALGLAALAACSAPATRPAGPAAVDPAEPALRVTDMDGDAHELGAVLRSNRPVALVFWQTWCGSCLAEGPALAAAAREHGDAIQFVGVVPGPDGVVEDAAVREVAASLGDPYPQVRDRDLALTRLFAVDGTPTIVVVGPTGRVVYRGHRPPADWGALH